MQEDGWQSARDSQNVSAVLPQNSRAAGDWDLFQAILHLMQVPSIVSP